MESFRGCGGFCPFFTAPNFDLEVLEVTSPGIVFGCRRKAEIVWRLLGVLPSFSPHPTLTWRSWCCRETGIL
jgi:hypothetical protein